MLFTLVNNSTKDLIRVNLMSLVQQVDPPSVVTVRVGTEYTFTGDDSDLPAVTRRFKAFCVSESIPHGGLEGAKLLAKGE